MRDQDLATQRLHPAEVQAYPQGGPSFPEDNFRECQENSAPADTFNRYVREIRRHPILSREEEARLTRLYYETASQEAKDMLVTGNLRLVIKIASRFQNHATRNLADLVQEGNLGLLRAVEKFNPYRGVKFSYYAAYWIKAYIYKFILDNWKLVKIGNTEAQRKLFFNLGKEKRRLRSAGQPVDSQLLAARLQVKEEDVMHMEQCLEGSELSLHAAVEPGSDEIYLNFLTCEIPSIQQLLAEQEERQALRTKLKRFRRSLTLQRHIMLYYNPICGSLPLWKSC